MKKFTLTLLVLFMASTIMIAQNMVKTTGTYDKTSKIEKKVINLNTNVRTDSISCDFEDIADWALDFTPWIALDVDGLDTYGFTDYTFPGDFDPMAFICFNPATTDPPMTDDPEIQPHSGEKFGACMAAVPSGGQGNDDWFISKLTSLGVNSDINFWAKSYTADYGLERFNIGVSTTGMNPEDFTIISATPYEEAPAVWTEFNFDLSEYDYQEVYIAIQCVSNDAFVFMLDDIIINTTPTNINDNELSRLVMYPNPAQDMVVVKGNFFIEQISIYNNVGQMIFNQNDAGNSIIINTNDYKSGIYFVRIKTIEGYQTQKLIIK